MVENTTISAEIILRAGVMHNIQQPDSTDEVRVRSRKVLVGNLMLMRTLDGGDCTHLFRVGAGGLLYLQFVRTFRGRGELIATILVLKDWTTLIELRGCFSAFDIIFTNVPPLRIAAVQNSPDLSSAVRIFGGQIFNVGKTVTITLS